MLTTDRVSRRQAVRLSAASVLGLALPAFADTKAMAGIQPAVKSVLAAHDKAFTMHDMQAVLATFSPKAVLIGTGPGEIWRGHTEISDAYQHFFGDFDAGKQNIQVLWAEADEGGDMAWFASQNHVTFSKGAKHSEFGLNLSLAFEKAPGKWLIRTMHFSNLAGTDKPRP